MNIQTSDHLDHDKDEIQNNADHEGPGDFFQIHRMMMVTKTVVMVMVMTVRMIGAIGMIVIMGMRLFHWLRSYCIEAGYGVSGTLFLAAGFTFLAVVVPGRRERIDDLTIGNGHCRMRCFGGNDMNHTRGEQVFFAPYHHFELALHDIGGLLMYMMVFRQDTAFPDIPKCQRAGLAMNHFAKEAGPYFFGGNIAEVSHVFFIECTKIVVAELLSRRNLSVRR